MTFDTCEKTIDFFAKQGFFASENEKRREKIVF